MPGVTITQTASTVANGLANSVQFKISANVPNLTISNMLTYSNLSPDPHALSCVYNWQSSYDGNTWFPI